MMTQDEARRLLDDARAAVIEAEAALEAAKAEQAETRQRVAETLGPFKVGDRVQRVGDTRIYEITGGDVWVYDFGVFPVFLASLVNKDGKPGTRGRITVVPNTVAGGDNWQRVSLPQAETEGGE